MLEQKTELLCLSKVCICSAFSFKHSEITGNSQPRPSGESGHCHWSSITKHLIVSTVCSVLYTRALGLHPRFEILETFWKKKCVTLATCAPGVPRCGHAHICH